MSQNDIINKLMKQWQGDVDKYRNELKKQKAELEEIRKEMASLKEVKETQVITETKAISESEPESRTFTMDQKAEIFLDYTVMFSQNDEEVIVYANLHMKNTGNVHLENPWICIRMDPPGLAKLSGKILPPNAVEAMGVYTLDGAMDGWVFMKKGEEWEKDVRRGEYWIQSIQPIVIPPNESEVLNGFQFIIPRNKSDKNFIVNAIVFLNNTQYVSNNKISLQLI
ncbi:MAG TPA: hypothetical protein DDY49_12000 [Paenibacillaceae bacterium]|nr:hypothetical protein [Paenibacillaceae bacterium]